MEKMELVSILIRTCNRPDVLRNALESVRNQTYKNIEVILVEDGKNTCQALLKEFSDVNIKYFCTEEKRGRAFAGNKALELATGKYLNFLDDDDYFFPEHIKILVETLQKSEERVAYAVAYEIVAKYNRDTSRFEEYKRFVRFRQPFNRIFLYFNNYLPIQCVMFERNLYQELGGFDETLDLLEDWELWVRYSTKTRFLFVDRVTSAYHVPRKKMSRSAGLHNSYEDAVAKFKEYKVNMSVYEMNRDLQYILEVKKTPAWKRKAKEFRNKVIYKKKD